MRKVNVDGRKRRFEDVGERQLESSMAFDCRLWLRTPIEQRELIHWDEFED